MSVVAPITVTWQNVNDPDLDTAQKEIEVFEVFEPAVLRAQEVIIAAEDSNDDAYSRVDDTEQAVAHLTLHPGNYAVGGLENSDFNQVFATVLPGAVLSGTGSLNTQATSNLSNLNAISGLGALGTGGDIVFTSNVRAEGDEFVVDVDTIDMTAANITSIQTTGGSLNLSSNASVNVSADNYNNTVANSWNVNTANSTISVDNEHRIAGDPANAQMFVEVPTTFEDNVTVDGVITISNASFTSLSDGDVPFSTTNGDLQKDDDFTYDESTQTLNVPNITTASDVDIQGQFNLATGTTVDDIATSISSASNDDSLATEGAIVSFVGGSGFFGEADQSTFSGDGIQKQFLIPHGLSNTPTSWFVQPVSDEGSGISHVEADATNLIVNYDTAPPTGGGNIVLNWLATEN